MARIDEDGYNSLVNHVENLKVRKEFLNQAHFDAIRYEGPGTELTVQLPSKHLWISGMENDE